MHIGTDLLVLIFCFDLIHALTGQWWQLICPNGGNIRAIIGRKHSSSASSTICANRRRRRRRPPITVIVSLKAAS